MTIHTTYHDCIYHVTVLCASLEFNIFFHKNLMAWYLLILFVAVISTWTILT